MPRTPNLPEAAIAGLGVDPFGAGRMFPENLCGLPGGYAKTPLGDGLRAFEAWLVGVKMGRGLNWVRA